MFKGVATLNLLKKFLQSKFDFQNLAQATTSSFQPGYLLIHPIYTQSPITTRLLLALVNVDFTLVALETGRAGAREATGVVMATAAIETWLWLTLIKLDLTSDPCDQSSKDVRRMSESAGWTEGKGANMNKAFTGCDHVWTAPLSHNKASADSQLQF